MKDPGSITELNKVLGDMDAAVMFTNTKIRVMSSLYARYRRANEDSLATVVKAKISEYRLLGRRRRSRFI